MGLDILKQLILCFNVALIVLFLYEKVNVANKEVTKRKKTIFVILLSLLLLINLRFAGNFRILGVYGIQILLSYFCFKRNIISAIINTSIVYIIYSVGDIASGITLMSMLKLDIFTIQSSFVISLIINQMIFIITYLIVLSVKFIILKIKDFEIDRKSGIMVLSNLVAVFLLVFINGYIYEYMLKYGQHIVARKHLNIYIVTIFLILLSVSIFIIYIVNRHLQNKNKLYEIVENSKIDNMTGTLNRESGLEILRDLIKENSQKCKYLTVCYVDINNLKYVNDNFGHSEGDILIKEISTVIKNNLRKTDTITRLGGDEFLLTFNDCRLYEAKDILNRITDILGELSAENRFKYNLSISYGLYEVEPNTTISIENIMEMADKAMYENKKKFKLELTGI